HIVVGHRLLELYELFPDHFADVELNLPETGDDMPDLLDEALWVVDFFKRLQREDGGVYGGIESNGHPSKGEPSYLDTLSLYAFTPDVQSTWRYAAVAAHAAHVMRMAGFDEKADDYLASARRAMDWAEAQYERDMADLTAMRIWWEVRNDRNLAAAHLYRVTGEELYHDIFEESSGMLDGELPFLWESHDNLDAAFVYARLGDDLADPELRDKMRASLVAFADARMKYQDGQAFMWTARDDGAPLLGGFASAPKGRIMSVAHVLTGEDKYLAATIGSTMASVGANPKNMTFTTGLGHAWPEFPMQVDRDVRGEPVAWPGQTLYGLHDQEFQPLPDWVTTWVATPETTEPAPTDWPVMVSF
ncbi:MAG: glycoside hydrolase family 9 protein, partial [Planctomycetota bacterium]